MKNKAAKSWLKNSRCVLTIFAALFIGGCATETTKKPQGAASAVATPVPQYLRARLFLGSPSFRRATRARGRAWMRCATVRLRPKGRSNRSTSISIASR